VNAAPITLRSEVSQIPRRRMDALTNASYTSRAYRARSSPRQKGLWNTNRRTKAAGRTSRTALSTSAVACPSVILRFSSWLNDEILRSIPLALQNLLEGNTAHIFVRYQRVGPRREGILTFTLKCQNASLPFTFPILLRAMLDSFRNSESGAPKGGDSGKRNLAVRIDNCCPNSPIQSR
jgi:hypothetical protein